MHQQNSVKSGARTLGNRNGNANRRLEDHSAGIGMGIDKIFKWDLNLGIGIGIVGISTSQAKEQGIVRRSRTVYRSLFIEAYFAPKFRITDC